MSSLYPMIGAAGLVRRSRRCQRRVRTLHSRRVGAVRIVDIATAVVHDQFMYRSPSCPPMSAIHRDEAAARSARRAQRTASSTRRDDIWNAGQRSETPLKRADRNFAELLQELRVAQTGVQILFAFLLGLAFTNRFATLASRVSSGPTYRRVSAPHVDLWGTG
jgi:hypothetical protein